MENYKIISHEDYLAHHGILGQKWGVRRFQNEDGSLTNEGRKRYGDNSFSRYRSRIHDAKLRKQTRDREIQEKYNEDEKEIESLYNKGALLSDSDLQKELSIHNRAQQDWKRSKDQYRSEKRRARNELIDPDTIARTVTIAAGVATAAYLLKHPEKIESITTGVGRALSKAGESAANAALATIGTIAIFKVAERYSPSEFDTETQRNIRQIALNSSTAAINTVTNAKTYKQQVSQPTKSANIDQAIRTRLGPPSNSGVDKSTSRWAGLFVDNNGNPRPAEVKSVIRGLASEGYDINQIEAYLDSIEHSAFTYYGTVYNPW